MCYRFLFFFCIAFSFAQDTFQEYTLDSCNYNLDQPYFITLSNIGDPILLLTPFNNETNFFLSHYSLDVRKINYFNNYRNIKNDSIYSHIFYKSSYKEGGVLETFLTRPVGKNIKLNFSYSNLSSLGFYANQKNQYSYLNFLVDYFSFQNPFSFSFLFSSNNGFYNQNGGVKYLDLDLDNNLMITYLNSETIIKNRKIQIKQIYFVNSDLKFQHNVIFTSFYRNYMDESPSSYHYSLNPLYSATNTSLYEDSILFKTLFNSFEFSNKNVKISINHNNYIINNYDFNQSGDLDISFSNTELFSKKRNMAFLFSFCPIGYNKNNIIIDLDIQRKKDKIENDISFLLSSRKPDFFHYPNNEFYNLDMLWKDFKSVKTISLQTSSDFYTRSLILSTIFTYYSNYVYFNQIASPSQSDNNLFYSKIELEKTWQIKNFIINSAGLIQYTSDEKIISVPLFLISQSLSYDKLIFNDIRLLSLLKIRLFSKYYIPSYFPLLDVFYQQQQYKSGMIPLASLNLSLYKKYFSFGIIVDNINSIFYKGEALVQDYILPPTNLRIAIKWQFVD